MIGYHVFYLTYGRKERSRFADSNSQLKRKAKTAVVNIHLKNYAQNFAEDALRQMKGLLELKINNSKWEDGEN